MFFTAPDKAMTRELNACQEPPAADMNKLKTRKAAS